MVLLFFTRFALGICYSSLSTSIYETVNKSIGLLVNQLTLCGYRSMIVVYSSAFASIGEQVNKTSLNLLPKSYEGFRRNTQTLGNNWGRNNG